MKIAFIYDAVYPWVKGGAEKRIYELAKRMAKNGHEVHWYGIGWWFESGNEDIVIDGIQFHGVCKPIDLYNPDGKRSIKEALYFALKLFPVIIRENFDIIECQNFPFFPYFSVKLYSILKRKKIIVTFHEVWGDYWYDYLGKKGFFGKLLEKIIIRNNDNFIAVSENTKNKIIRIKPNANVEIVPNGVNLELIQQIKPSKDKSDLIFVGRLIKDKNVDLLIKSIKLVKKEIPNIKCVIIGDGPEKDMLKNLTKELKIEDNIKFFGILDEYVELISYLKSSKVFVLPSTREGFGIVVLEANSCGLPVVTVNHPMNAAKDLIKQHQNGILCELSIYDLKVKILALLKINTKMKCINNAKRYDWDKISVLAEKKYLEVLL